MQTEPGDEATFMVARAMKTIARGLGGCQAYVSYVFAPPQEPRSRDGFRRRVGPGFAHERREIRGRPFPP